MSGQSPAREGFVMTIGKKITAASAILVGLSAVIGAVAVLSIGGISQPNERRRG
jgi:hypothetical protein